VHVQPVHIQPVHVQMGNAGRDDDTAVLYRVRVGPLPDRAVAARLEQDLSYMGLGRPHVVP
jgi:hypothetical protein